MWTSVIMGLLALLTSAYGDVIVYTQDIPHSIMEEFRDMPASFGADLPPEGLRGFLVAGVPDDGCSALEKPPVVDNFTGKWIVLIARYNCSFEVKVRNAQTAGFDCAIVHNVNSSELETMSAKNAEDILIPSVFVNDLAGLMLAGQYQYTSGFYIMVNGDLPFNINTHLLLPFAIVVVLCLLVILIFMIVKCIKDRRRARRHQLPRRALLKIPTCKFSKGDPYETCAICLDDYQEGDKLRVLPCAHAYHALCIDPWLTQNKRVCPVCKRRVLTAGERARRRLLHSDSDSDSDAGAGADDTEPLLPDRPPSTTTQGGTFVEQSENPFARASRFMARLRGAAPRAPRDAPHTPHTPHAPHASSPEVPSSAPQGNDDTNNANGDNGNVEDTRPLIRSVVVSERRARRSRRARSAGAAAAAARRQPEPLLHPDAHSINGNAHQRGEIGVAALPAPAQPNTPRHLAL